MMIMNYKKAVKYEAKGRVALIGPAGSGKSWTMLTLARTLAGPTGKIAAIDTEHGSLSKYADLYEFDVIELGSFSVANFLSALKAAEEAGYSVFCCDSLSHFWTGKDGALEFVDMASKRYKDNMGGWKEFRPHERAMVDAMIASPCHVIVTMRTKTEYQDQINQSTGKKQRVKIGLAPVQREGLEYEFDLVGYMDDENTLIADKTRCPAYTGKAIAKPSAKDFSAFAEWLKGKPLQSENGIYVSTKTIAPVEMPVLSENPLDMDSNTPNDAIEPAPEEEKISEPDWVEIQLLAKRMHVAAGPLKNQLKRAYGIEIPRDLPKSKLEELKKWIRGEIV